MGLSLALKDTEPFNQLPEAVFAELKRAAISKKYPAHFHIFNQHDPPSKHLYIVTSGLVEIVALTPGGVEMVVDIRKEGSFFGGTPIFTNSVYTAGARTVTETVCYLIPAELLRKIATDYPRLGEYFTRTIYSRVRNLYSEMVDNHNRATLPKMEAYPFQKRLAEIMSRPVETCALDTSVKAVARQMTRKKVGAILVCDENRKLAGIITERDLVIKSLARESSDDQPATAADVMTVQPFTMTPDTYMYEATSFMVGHQISYLPILDEQQLVGIVTQQDLMKYRSQKSLLLVGSIKEATSIDELKAAKGKLVKVAKGLMSEARTHTETVEILSYIHHCILRRGFEITLENMQAKGLTQPDIRYCFFIMGSGGRKEMLLGPDQDNGFLFENYPESRRAEVDAFFIPLAEQLVETFEQIGYPRCKGNVMANNPLWRGRLSDWKTRIADWINTPEPQKVRYSTIFFDFMPLVGEASLCQELRNIVHEQIRKFPLFLYHMMELDFKHKVPITLLGRFQLEKDEGHSGQLSIKQTGSIFIVDCVRMFMLKNQVDATTTCERLDLLVRMKIFTQDSAEHLKAAFEAFTYLRLRNEIQQIEQGQEPSHYLDPYALSPNEQDLLKEAFRAASKLQDSTKRQFNVG
ncbi:MAG TPA: putative nucleotidyltransferase substrate binding domain-containing protein [Malonomonas sp.]